MPKIQVARRGTPVQVDNFPNALPASGGKFKVFVRSREGALHLRPGSVTTISEDELSHIKTTPAHAALAARITVLPEPRRNVKAPPGTKPQPAKFDDGKPAKRKATAVKDKDS